MTIVIKIVDTLEDDNVEVEYTFPSKNEVCSECEGHGYVLCEGMREHAYTAEEFNEAFSEEEDRAAYFQRGGKYDVVCHICKGKNVVPVVDESRLTTEQKEVYKIYLKQKEEQDEYEAQYAAELRMERMMGC